MNIRLVPAIVLSLILPHGAAALAEEACGTCHPKVKTEFNESIHARSASCTGCHGGDGAALEADQAHSAGKGFRGKVDRKSLPALCSSCHSDPNRMKAFGLATDQYAQYQTSGHGQRFAKGDMAVAICTDCHGTHAIISTKLPASPVAPRNVPATCGRCHSDQALMQKYNLAADQVEKFSRSVHGIALLDEWHPAAPTCSTCHGAHGAIALGAGSLSKVCGHCHSRTREYFQQGPHGKAAEQGKISECMSCHGSHDTQPPDRTLFDTTCESCHPAGSAGALAAQKLKTLLTQAQESVSTAAEALAAGEREFPTVVRFRPRMQQGWGQLMEALPVQHSLSVDRVSDLVRNARSISDEVRGEVHGVQQAATLRYVWLGLIWIVILFLVALLHLYRKEKEAERAGNR